MNPKLHALDRAPEIGPDTRVVIAEALVPVRWWRGVAVSLRSTAALTPMERFLLETALAFGAAASAEFAEITDLPAELYPVLGRRLVAAGALAADGTPLDLTAARGMLDAERLRTERTMAVDVVALPATGDVVILHAGNAGREPLLGWERARVPSVSQYPVDADLVGRTVADIVTAAAGERMDIVRVDADTVAFADGLCPVYRCSAQVVDGSGSAVRLSIGPEAPSVTLTGLDRLIAGWTQAERVVRDRPLAVWRALLAGGEKGNQVPVAQRTAAARWRLPVTGRQAAQLVAAGRNLAVAAGLAVETADVVVEVVLEFSAADPDAAATIAVDEAINAAVTAGSAADVLHDRLAVAAAGLPAAAVAGLAPTAVLNRAWQLGQHRLAYALREREDFGYA